MSRIWDLLLQIARAADYILVLLQYTRLCLYEIVDFNGIFFLNEKI